MAFGLAEILTDGWLIREELFFGAKEAAISVAIVWVRMRGAPIGVADTETRELVWRSDRGPLRLPYLGMKLPGKG